jgi:hypothetical protein
MDVDVPTNIDDDGPCIYGPISKDHFLLTNYFILANFHNSTNFQILAHFQNSAIF